MTVAGLDVGAPQGAISLAAWRQIRGQGRRFAFLRCLEGAGPTVDPTFVGNVAGARAAGMLFGAYFVLHPWLDPVTQATAWFDACRRLGTAPGELPPVLDIELDHTSARALTPAQVLAALVRSAAVVALLWGRAPVVYTYPDFERRDILGGGDTSPLAGTILWYAAYRATPPAPPAPWTRVTFWQDAGGTSYRTPEGAPCDDDVFLGTEAELEALANFTAPLDRNPLAGDTAPLVIPGVNDAPEGAA